MTAALLVFAIAVVSQAVRPVWTAERVPVINAAGIGDFLEAQREAPDSYGAGSDLPDGEVQYVTFNAAVVDGLTSAETSVTADGTSVSLASPIGQ